MDRGVSAGQKYREHRHRKNSRAVARLRRRVPGGLYSDIGPQTLAAKVSSLMRHTLGMRPLGSFQLAMVSTITTSYVREPAVKAWLLQAAKGQCEGCDSPAPFIGNDGLPYLEVHHVMLLASHGSDTTTNAVALCPNRHRRCHSSIGRDNFKLQLYQKIPRLIVEAPTAD